MSIDTVYTRTMRRALDALGGPAQLSEVLGVSASEIHGWANGHAIPPPGMFLKAIDLLMQDGWNPRRRKAS